MRPLVQPLRLTLRTPFRIAHGASSERLNVLYEIDGSFGEAALPPYYPYGPEAVYAYLDRIDLGTLLGDDPFALEAMLDRMPPGPPPARAALDAVLHDRWAKALGQPLFRCFGSSAAQAPSSSITVSLAQDQEELLERLHAVRDAPVVKLKLGSGSLDQDIQTVALARGETGAALCVDANGGWPPDEVTSIIDHLLPFSLLFVEEPVRSADPAVWRLFRQDGFPPIIADESVQGPADLLRLADSIDGVNLKLAKTGGLRGARQMIALARTLGLKVMIGCMIESTVGVTTAAHLAPLADFADLDGHLDVVDDPFKGLRFDNGRLVLPERPGLGLLPATTLSE